ncbi:MAG: ester cyclase [bacterium]
MLNHRRSIAAFCAVVALCAISLGFTPAGDEEKNTAAVKRFYDEVMNKGNMKVIDELVADSFVEHYTPNPKTPANKAGLTQTMTMFRTAFPDLQVTVEDIIAKGDKVWAYTTMRGTNKGEFMGMPATGKKIEVKGVDIVRFANGKAIEHWGLNDDLTMMQQLGMIPMPGQDAAKQ